MKRVARDKDGLKAEYDAFATLPCTEDKGFDLKARARASIPLYESLNPRPERSGAHTRPEKGGEPPPPHGRPMSVDPQTGRTAQCTKHDLRHSFASRQNSAECPKQPS
ncbi:hypothetical protein Sa4125_24000 [Aureimonas sp. SA4125]|nr:hypothetical protein Sa4125_24000 [Aureimonas sp. SA4125]